MPDARVNIFKKDLDEDFGTDYPLLHGIVRCYITWAVEQSRGPFKKKVDLNAFGSAANASHEFVGTAHKDFPVGASGLMEYGGDVVAKSGNFAEEFVDIDLTGACGRRDISDIVFGSTCLGKPQIMANLGELHIRVTQPTFQMEEDGITFKRTKPSKDFPLGQRIVVTEEVLIHPELRSIEQPATAAMFLRFKLTPQGAYLRRTNDMTDYQAPRGLTGQQTWRNLLGGLRDVVERDMVVPAA
jgi:hypothetical protein